MDWNSISHFLYMDGQTDFMYGVLTSDDVILCVAEIFSLKSRRAKAVNRLTHEARAVRAAREN